MSQSVGTVAQLHRATGVPVRTIQRWAATGKIRRVGSTYPPRYDGHEVMRLKVRNTLRGRSLGA